MANLTLLEWAKRQDPNGDVAMVANILAQTNEILADCVHVEGNLPTGHRVTVTTGLPEIYYRSLNQGIPTSKATTAQIDEGSSIAEARTEIDIELVRLQNNQAEFRLSEAEHFLEAMNQKQATGMFYGNPQNDPTEFLGLAQRYSNQDAGNAQNIIDGLGDTANEQTSAWLVAWGEQSVFCHYPKGSTIGLERQDLGEQTAFEFGGAGLRLQVLAERFVWKMGMAVKDWRGAVRICNLDTSDFADLSEEQLPTSFTHILHLMTRAHNKIPRILKARANMAWYVNPSVFTLIQRIGLEKSQNAVMVNPAVEQFGKGEAMLSYLGVPIRQCDAILNTEAVVPAATP